MPQILRIIQISQFEIQYTKNKILNECFV